MPDQVDRANDIEERITEQEIERIRDADADDAAGGPARPGDVRTQTQVEQWIKAQTSIRPKKPLPKP